ncbi:MAG: MBL fold metallo-hydrolase [Rikenellaceae bacterium]|nr:MBL fold metallo-hydrolase [Rikenellaceae bacterium]
MDCGPDFRQQMLRERVMRLDAVLFTHDHKDHIAGIDDVRAFNYTSGRAVDFYAEEYVQRSIRREFAYAFDEHKYPGVPEIELHTIDEKPFLLGRPNTEVGRSVMTDAPMLIETPDSPVPPTEIIPIRGWHYRLPVLGFRIGYMAYLTDMNRIDPWEIEKISGIDILIITALRNEKHLSHFNLEEALGVIEKAAPGRAYLTHLSHQMGLHEEVSRILPPHVFLGYDGLMLEAAD